MSTLVKCPNGHYYDSEKYASCPFCDDVGNNAANEMTAPMPGIFEDDLSATIPDTSSDAIPSAMPGSGAPVTVGDDDFDKTIGMAVWNGSTSGGKTVPVVGWLVCTKGSEIGKSFELKAGRNFVGRSSENDVVIKGDQAVSRKEHAVIVFDPKAGKFHVQPGSSSELFYVNGEVVLQVVGINDRDRISLGDTELLFVPLCDERFTWED